MATGQSIIHLSPASQAFVDARRTTVGPWVIGGFIDCTLMGVVLCQLHTYVRTRTPQQGLFQRSYTLLIIAVTLVSILKTTQAIAIVWVQNVVEFANPDKARVLLSQAWWQVSAPLLTGISGFLVQCFFCTRFYLLSGNWFLLVFILLAMCLGLAGACLSLFYITIADDVLKVRWLLIHLVGVFIADFLITSGTIVSLRKRKIGSGLDKTTDLVNRLIRLVFESAFPPTFFAMIDLILTQTLGPHLLWHLLVNYALSKLYVISFLYTLNSISRYREKMSSIGHESSVAPALSYNNGRFTRRSHMPLNRPDQIFVHTQVSTHIDSPIERDKLGGIDSPKDVVLDVLGEFPSV